MHPVFKKYQERINQGVRYAEHIDETDVAKLLRERLKSAYPGVKFSVRVLRYSMGSSIQVSWTGGPATMEVYPIGEEYAFGGFDGMIDMAYSKSRWLLPDGTLAFASTRGTVGSTGTVPAREMEKPHPDAILVKYGPDHVSCQQQRS